MVAKGRRLNRGGFLLAALLLLLVAASWPGLTPEETIARAETVAVGRVVSLLPTRLVHQSAEGYPSTVSGLVFEVETYLGPRSGPPVLHVAIPTSATVCDGKTCMGTPAFLRGEDYLGRRLLLLLERMNVVGGLTPVLFSNGIVFLEDTGLTASETSWEPERAGKWNRYLQGAPRRPPDPAAPPVELPPEITLWRPLPGMRAPAAPKETNAAVAIAAVAALFALAGFLAWRILRLRP